MPIRAIPSIPEGTSHRGIQIRKQLHNGTGQRSEEPRARRPEDSKRAQQVDLEKDRPEFNKQVQTIREETRATTRPPKLYNSGNGPKQIDGPKRRSNLLTFRARGMLSRTRRRETKQVHGTHNTGVGPSLRTIGQASTTNRDTMQIVKSTTKRKIPRMVVGTRKSANEERPTDRMPSHLVQAWFTTGYIPSARTRPQQYKHHTKE